MARRDTQSASRLDSFLKILEMEKSRSFDDGSVIGGLDRYLKRWSEELAAQLGSPSLVDELAGASYGTLSRDQRSSAISRWLDLAGRPGPGDAGSGGSIGRETGSDLKPGRKAATQTSDVSGGMEPKEPPPADGLNSPVTVVRGVDVKNAARLNRLGVDTVRDLLYFFPRRHNDYTQVSKIADLVPGQQQSISGVVWDARETVRGARRIKTTETVISDDTGNIKVTFFGNPYLARQLKTNGRIMVSGRVEVIKGQLEFQSPEYELLDRQDDLVNAGRMVPVYPLTSGLAPRSIRRITWQALERWLPWVEENLPEHLVERIRLMPLPQAIMQAHYPRDAGALEESRQRLAFQELLVLQLAALTRRHKWQQSGSGVSIQIQAKAVNNFVAGLPFVLTAAQRRCLAEIGDDIARESPPMGRLLQGEVGSGKTVVALAALLAAVSAGYQGTIMVPTEVLAEQHFATVSQLLAGLPRPKQQDSLFSVYLDPIRKPVSIGLLVGSTRQAVKRELQELMADGNLDIIIGTHALIQEGVEAPRQALAVVDEQHRFGVLQRSALRERSSINPHLLVMSATPIPRTLALTLYGDMDISVIDELPPGRLPVLTRWLAPHRRDDAYGFVSKEVAAGRQAFVVCPLIEESDAIEAKAATDEFKRLSNEVFPDLRLGLLHGRLRPAAKEEVMRKFRDGQVDILVSTPVVEVGIDVPNASVMLVEGADRFGLAQLHQFRGRVGRGTHKSYCLLLADDPSDDARERLSALERIQNGFELAEVDLSLRGPGDFFGTRQSGLPTLRMARLSDQELLRSAREEASALLQDDPTLEKPEHSPLSAEVQRFLSSAVAEES